MKTAEMHRDGGQHLHAPDDSQASAAASKYVAKAIAGLVRVEAEEEDLNLDEFDWKRLCLSTKEACSYLGIGRTSFWRIANTLPSVNLPGGRRYWCRKGLERWVKANTQYPHRQA